MQSDRIKALQDAIFNTHGCKSKYIESVPVTEMFNDKRAWTGEVGVFDLIGHRTAKRAYAWNYHENKESKATVVLESGPVNSAQSAVKVAIAAKAREEQAAK